MNASLPARPRVGSIATGIGGLERGLAAAVPGAAPVWVADPDPDAELVLARRFPGVPNHGDVRGLDWSAVEPVDVITAGPPCQPHSAMGKQEGAADARDLWSDVLDAVEHLRPRLFVLETVPGARRELGLVLGRLARLGFVAEWGGVSAAHAAAPHRRARLWLCARPPAPDAEGERGRAAAAQADAVTDGAGHGEGRRPPRGLAVRGAARAQPHYLDGLDGLDPVLGTAEDDGGRVDHALADGAEWGPYGPAVEHWTECLGRRPPRPLDALGRVNAAFTEWMLGYPRGWVTDVPGVTARAARRLLGNSVCPQAAELALALLLPRLDEAAPAEQAEAATPAA